MFFRTSASVIALVAGASLAMAADLEGPSYGSLKDDIPAPTAYRWDGVYIGGHLGWAWANPVGGIDCDSITRITGKNGKVHNEDHRKICGNLHQKEIGSNSSPHKGDTVDYFQLGWGRSKDYVAIIDKPSDESDSSFLGGAQGGINKQFGNFVVGLEADWSGISDISRKTGLTFEYFDHSKPTLHGYDGTGEVSFDTELDWLATFRARLGAVLTSDGRLLGYVTGGAAIAKVSSSYGGLWTPDDDGRACNACDFSPPKSDTFYQFGGAIGAGLEYALTDRFTIGAEYLYISLTGKEEKSVTFFDGEAGRSFNVRDEVGFDDIHTIKVKANFKFNH